MKKLNVKKEKVNKEKQIAEPQKLSDKMIVCENLVKIYKTKDIEVVGLQGLDLEVKRGEIMAIIGSSGSGKSTLLNILGALDKPSAGKVLVAGKDILKFNEKQIMSYKKKTVGFVWQNNARNLIPYLNVTQNVEVPMLLRGVKKRKERALELVEMVGLTNRKSNKLGQLSGGEQQRVAIAISLANRPELILADEPTGSVDTKTTGLIMDIFKKINRELGVTVVIVTHDMLLSKTVDRVVAIRDGRTSSEFLIKKAYQEKLEEIKEDDFENVLKEENTHEELVVLDRHGRLTIPNEYSEKLGIKNKNKVKMELEDGKIVIYPYDEKDIININDSGWE